jgi:hypothetical protein
MQETQITIYITDKKKLIQKYNEKLFEKAITQIILNNSTIDNHKKSTVLMLIVDLKHHKAILSKF